jgi:hypothetical protein
LFLAMMVIGLVGLVMMALPALGGHGHSPQLHGHGMDLGHGSGHAGHLGAGHAVAGAHGAAHTAGPVHVHPTAMPVPGAGRIVLATAASGGRRLIPSPRAVFSLFALYGAFGNALVHAAHLRVGMAALLAIVPAFLVERLLIRPVWNLLFRFRAEPNAPLEALVLCEAQAVVPFRNGRGLVTTVRDGRRVQLNARLCESDAGQPVNFGQRLRIEDVDSRRERVTVSVLRDDKAADNPT